MKEDIKDTAQFAAGQFYLNAPKVRIRSRSNPTYEFNASGYIELTSSREIYFRFFKHLSDDSDAQALRQASDLRHFHHYDFEITDLYGNNWFAYDVRPSIQSGYNRSLVLSGIILELLFIQASSYLETRNHLIMRFPCRIDFPTTKRHKVEKFIDGVQSGFWTESYTEIVPGNYTITIASTETHTYLRAIGNNTAFGYFAPKRILETLEFILSEGLAYCTIQRIINGTEYRSYYSTHLTDTNPSRYRPVNYQFLDSADSAVDLFVKYFEFIEYHSDYYRPPVHQAVFSVLSMEHTTIEAHGLSISTSIEALVKGIKSQPKVLTDPEIEDFKSIKRFLKTIQTPDIRSRLGGLFSRYCEWSEYSILKLFANNHGLPERTVMSWRYFRDTLAHGKEIDWAEVDERGLRFDDLFALFYGLIFEQIGYEGKISNFLDDSMIAIDWPLKNNDQNY